MIPFERHRRTNDSIGVSLDFARWRSDVPSGGNHYDDELTAFLRAQGLEVREHLITGAWPVPKGDDRRRLAEALAGGRYWLVDNILGSAAPEVIGDAVARGRRVTLLLHYFPADDSALSASDRQRLAETEAAAVRAASNVVVTSGWAASEVRRRYGRNDAAVAEPGIRPADPAPGSLGDGRPPALLWLGRLTRDKDPHTFVDALEHVRDIDWTAHLVGPIGTDPALAMDIRDRIATTGLSERIHVPGAQRGADLEALWAGTDLLVHTSRSETYGMVVSEALAHGIPAIVADGTAAREAQRVGSTFPVGDADALADEVRTWLTDSQLRRRWRAAAIDARQLLPTWADTAHVVARLVSRHADT